MGRLFIPSYQERRKHSGNGRGALLPLAIRKDFGEISCKGREPIWTKSDFIFETARSRTPDNPRRSVMPIRTDFPKILVKMPRANPDKMGPKCLNNQIDDPDTSGKHEIAWVFLITSACLISKKEY
jgi:hypothetical protein